MGKCAVWLKVIPHLRSHGTTATNPMPGKHAHRLPIIQTFGALQAPLQCNTRFESMNYVVTVTNLSQMWHIIGVPKQYPTGRGIQKV